MSGRAGARIRRHGPLLLFPLSVVPLLAAVPLIVRAHVRFERTHNMGPLPAPVVGLRAGEVRRFVRLPVRSGAVPVLVWHGIDGAADGYSTGQRAFARQLALLKRLGYTAISTRQWADFRAGRPTRLPARPILLTFDDGRLDSYRGADRVLQRFSMRAAMFVITGQIQARNPFYLTWTELHRMRDSGRWDIEPHARDGHRQITVSADGRQAAFYAARAYTRSGGRESLADWEARVDGDLFALRRDFAGQGITPHVFAVPYGDVGQNARNDPAIPRLLGGLLTRQFANWFIQADHNDPDFTTPGHGAAQRYELRTATTLTQLYDWLARHSAAPAAIAPAPKPVNRAFVSSVSGHHYQHHKR